jgi:hypothetical protein
MLSKGWHFSGFVYQTLPILWPLSKGRCVVLKDVHYEEVVLWISDG